ncbi:MAG: M28 family peptidase [Gemmatimonadaceae bacterium]
MINSKHTSRATVRATVFVFVALATACMPLAVGPTGQTSIPTSASGDNPPALAAIDTIRLRRDLFAMASDAMRGREAGTLDELRASAWVADRAREAGLQPGGDDGTYFQFWPMRRIRTADDSHASLDGAPLVLWQDAAVVSPVNATLDLPLVWVGTATGDALNAMDLRGKAVAAMLLPAMKPPAPGISLRGWRYARVAIAERTAALEKAGAAALVLVADDSTNDQFTAVSVPMRRGSYNIDTAGNERVPVRTPILWVPTALQSRVSAAKRLVLDLHADSFVYPSVNVVAKVPGTDRQVRDEYVLFSGHTDHDGVRFPVDGDSIWHGADDNASVSVALLAIGRAFVQHPGRRSALFVWHGAEERGLLGSRWFVLHPTVPLSSIAAVLNGDMIGRNNPDTAALLGSQPPHRNSTALVQMALSANDQVTKFVIDSSWDRPSHPEFWYFRSDHLPYARAGVPAIFFSTLLHADYHSPRDKASLINYPKLARMARWMYSTGWDVANAATRPALDAGFKLER